MIVYFGVFSMHMPHLLPRVWKVHHRSEPDLAFLEVRVVAVMFVQKARAHRLLLQIAL